MGRLLPTVSASTPDGRDRDGSRRSEDDRRTDLASADSRADGCPDHAARVERSRRKWDFWSRWYWINDRDTEPIRREAIDLLGLTGGETVVDLGCGPGSNFELLRERVGPDGRVLGVDVAPEMVRRVNERIRAAGWDNVAVVRADATRFPVVAAEVDAAVATLALAAMPDVRAVVEAVYEALPPGGRFAVYDPRLVPSGPARALNPLIRRGYRWIANWNEREDTLATLRDVFDDVEVVATYALGTQAVIRAEKRATE